MSDQQPTIRRVHSSNASVNSSQWSLAVNHGSESNSSQSQSQTNHDTMEVEVVSLDTAYRGITGDSTAFSDFTQRNRQRSRESRDVVSAVIEDLRRRRPQTARQNSQQSLKELSLYSETDHEESPDQSPPNLQVLSQRQSPVRENIFRNSSAPVETSTGSASLHDLQMIGAVHDEEGHRPHFLRLRRVRTC